jgi:hypothetical protein
MEESAKRIEALTADNARLRGAMTGIKRAAAHRMKNDPKDLHSYYFHTADAALNTGKEVMPDAALEEIGQLQARVEDQAREIADLTRQLQGQPRRLQDVAGHD